MPGRGDALDPVAGLGGLDDRGLAQRLQALGLLVYEQLLPPAGLAERAERRDLVGREAQAGEEGRVEAVRGGPIGGGGPASLVA